MFGSLPRTLLVGLPLPLSVKLGLRFELYEDSGLSRAGEEKREEGVEVGSISKTVDESRSFDGTFDGE